MEHGNRNFRQARKVKVSKEIQPMARDPLETGFQYHTRETLAVLRFSGEEA
jgi:hypothetical protein